LRGSRGDATLSEVKELPGQTTLANLDTLVGRIVVGAVLGHRIYAGRADGFDSSQLSADRRTVLDTSTSPPHTQKVSETIKCVPEGDGHVNSNRCIGTRCEPLSDSDDLGTA
jgi:hypothetical protein